MASMACMVSIWLASGRGSTYRQRSAMWMKEPTAKAQGVSTQIDE